MEIAFQALAKDRLVGQIAREETELATPAVLGGIERHVRRPHDILGADTVMRRDRYANRCTDHAASLVQRIGLRQHGDDPARNLAQLAAIVDVGQHDLELVATKTADLAIALDRPLEARSDLPQQFVPGGMTQSIVDLFETVEIEHQDRAIAFGSAKRGKRRLDRVGHAVAVRQTSERIELRKARGFLLALMLLGYVGAGAAKALELAGGGEDRAPRETDHQRARVAVE